MEKVEFEKMDGWIRAAERRLRGTKFVTGKKEEDERKRRKRRREVTR